MKIFWALGAIALVSVGTLLLRDHGSYPNDFLSDQESTELELPKQQNTTTLVTFSFEPKYLYQYRFEKKIRIQGFSNQFPEIDLKGVLFFHVIEKKSESYRALVWHEISGFDSSREKYLVQINPNKKLVQLYSDEKSNRSSEDEKNILKDLLANFFYFSNEDTVGKYTFEIVRSNQEGIDSPTFFKTKKVYTRKDKTTPHVTQFIQKIVLGQQNFPVKILSKEMARLGEGEFSFSSQSFTKIDLLNVTKHEVAHNLGDFQLKNTLQLVAQQLPIEDHPEYKKIHWPTILADLKNIQSLSSSDQLKLFGDLLKALKLDPTRVVELRKLLLNAKEIQAGAKSPIYQMVVGALATDGSSAAQEELIQIYEHPSNQQSGKGSILGALTTTQASPEKETLDFLREKAEGEKDIDLAQGALFALGSSLEKVKQAESEVQYLLRKWKEALASGNLNQQLAVMDALGNSGRMEFFDEVSTQAKSSNSVQLQARALFALRGMNATASRLILIEALFASDAILRMGAASAIYQAAWNAEFMAPLVNCSKSEIDDSVRNSCRETLAKNKVSLAGL